MKVLIIGASGMLGNMMIRILSEKEDWEVFGTVRSASAKRFFPPNIGARLVSGFDVGNQDTLVKVFAQVRPDVVINCVGLIKQQVDADDPLLAIPINSLLPHRLAELCSLIGSRLVHISTDCVFTGNKGGYTEDCPSDTKDLYGKSKFLGEVYYPHTITLRTSIIGHELQSTHGLIGWFLSQKEQCKGYSRAIFSGLPTVALAQLIRDVVIPKPELFGLYHIAAQPISKYDLLLLVAEVYGKSIKIIKDEKFTIDRSLNSDKFRTATGYTPPTWPGLIRLMHSYQIS